jgi:hypothetical protein
MAPRSAVHHSSKSVACNEIQWGLISEAYKQGPNTAQWASQLGVHSGHLKLKSDSSRVEKAHRRGGGLQGPVV